MQTLGKSATAYPELRYRVKVERTFSLIGYTKMDLGIAKYHFEIGAGKENFEWSRQWEQSQARLSSAECSRPSIKNQCAWTSNK